MPGSRRVCMVNGVLVDPVLNGVLLQKGQSEFLVLFQLLKCNTVILADNRWPNVFVVKSILIVLLLF